MSNISFLDLCRQHLFTAMADINWIVAGQPLGRNGFRKDKGGEKLAESEEDLLEHRTDGSDAFDTLYSGCEKFPYHDTFALSVSGVFQVCFL